MIERSQGAVGDVVTYHSSDEDESIACVSGLVVPISPDSLGCGVTCTGRARHDGTDKDADETATKCQEQTDIVDHWQGSVGEQYDATA